MAKESFAVVLEQFQKSAGLIFEELGKHIVGQRSVIEQMLSVVTQAMGCR